MGKTALRRAAQAFLRQKPERGLDPQLFLRQGRQGQQPLCVCRNVCLQRDGGPGALSLCHGRRHPVAAHPRQPVPQREARPPFRRMEARKLCPSGRKVRHRLAQAHLCLCLFGYVTTLDEEIRNWFIARYILNEESDYLFAHKRRNRDLLAQADVLVKQTNGQRLTLVMEMTDDGLHRAKEGVSKQAHPLFCVVWVLQQRCHIQRQIVNAILLSQVGGVQNDGRGQIVAELLDALVERRQSVALRRLYFNRRDVMP